MDWQSLKIKHKLFSGFGAILLITALFGFILLNGLYKINRSSRHLANNEIPDLSQIYDLQNHWQKGIFNLRSFTDQREKRFYNLANHHFKKAGELLDSLNNNSEKEKWDELKKELNHLKNKARESFQATMKVNSSYQALDSARHKLHKLSDNYLRLQYMKIKRDVDNNEPKHIIKRRADKISLMNEIISITENLKTSIGEAHYNNNPAILDSLPHSLSIIRSNVNTILPMTTKQYDVDALNQILNQNQICKESLETFKKNWSTYNNLNNHDFLQYGLTLTTNKVIQNTEQLKKSVKDNLQYSSNARNTWWWSISLALLTGIGLAWIINRSLSKPLLNLTNMAQLQSEGQLVEIPETTRKDEVGILNRSMKLQQEQTQKMVNSLKNTSQALNQLMEQIKMRSEKLSKTTTSQASSSQQITASMEQMSALIHKSSREVENASSELKKAKSDVTLYIEQNREAIQQMQELIERASTISELASQTYILSLNASIEASRDDKNNKGFGAIAKAVRDLAEKMKNISAELNDLSVEGGKKADNAIHNLDNISSIIDFNNEVLQNLATMSIQQNAEISQISNETQTLSNETQTTAQMAENMSEEAEQLRNNTEDLESLLSFYQHIPEKNAEKDDFQKWNQMILPDENTGFNEYQDEDPVWQSTLQN